MSRHLPPLANLVLQTTEEIILFMRVHRVYILIKLSMYVFASSNLRSLKLL